MKSFILGLVFLGLAQNSFAEDFGKQVSIYSDNTGPQFSTIFAYDQDKAWILTMSLWGGDLLPNHTMKTLAWRLFDADSGQYINQWTVAVENSSPVMYPGTMAFSWALKNESEVMAAIQALKNLKVILSVDQDLSAPVPTHFIDLGLYCQSNPDNFRNLTMGSSGCNLD